VKAKFTLTNAPIKIRDRKGDVILILVLASIASFLAYRGSEFFLGIFDNQKALDLWFDADVPFVFLNMAYRDSDHIRANVHPLFSLVALSLVNSVRMVFGADAIGAVRIVIGAIAFLWFGTLYILLRSIGCRRLDAAIFSMLAMTSAAAMFWFVVPETRPFGSLTILLGLLFVAASEYVDFSYFWYVAVSFLTLSITITNWMVGLLATKIDNSWKRFWQITGNAFFLVVLLWCLQKLIVPSAQLVVNAREKNFIVNDDDGGPLTVLKVFVFHTLVMPAIEITKNLNRSDLLPRLRIQHALAGSGSFWGTIAIALWIALLSLGLWGFFSRQEKRKFRIVLGLTLLGQLALHSFYSGDETFLYSLNFAPVLICLAALSTFTIARPIALAIAFLLIVAVGINNGLQFDRAVKFVQSNGIEIQQKTAASISRIGGESVAKPGIIRVLLEWQF
jgi:hypothetical protein